MESLEEEVYCDNIKYVLVGGKGTSLINASPLKLSLYQDEDPAVASYNHISEVAKVLDTGFSVNRICGTSLSFDFPCLSDNHLFVVLPLALHFEENTLIRYIYTINLEEDATICRLQIQSHLLQLDPSLPPFQSILHRKYAFLPHRRGPAHFTLPLSDEYTAGTILFLQEITDDDNDDNIDFDNEGIAATRDGAILLPNEPLNHNGLRRIGSQVVAVLPQSTCSTVLEDYPSDNEIQLDHKRPLIHENIDSEKSIEQDIHVDSEKSIEQEPIANKEISQLMLPGVQVEGQIDKQPAALILNKESSLFQCPPIPPIKQQERLPSQTTLSTIKTNESYPYAEPKQQSSISHSMSPLAADVRNSLQPPKYEDLPLSISDYLHGQMLYARECLSKLVPSGRFASLPNDEDIGMYMYDQIGKGRNGKVYKYVINGNPVALKYTKYRKNESDICRQLLHDNIVPVLGVFVVDCGITAEKMCCQIMPLMTCSLRDEIHVIGGGIVNALKSKLSEDNLFRNLPKIYGSILKGLNYLLEKNVEIQDLKDSNILVYKTCNCESVYVCNCACGYSVELSDFDSVCISRGGPYKECDVHKVKRKTPDRCAKVLGTPCYRAPEKFLDHCDCKGVTITGPWCDIWSFGVFLINQLLGLNIDERNDIIKEANILCGVITNCHKLDSHDPQPELFTPRLKLSKICCEVSKLIKDIICLVWQCIEADCRHRATPKQLLNDHFFTAS